MDHREGLYAYPNHQHQASQSGPDKILASNENALQFQEIAGHFPATHSFRFKTRFNFR
jgi:hypothetical protein